MLSPFPLISDTWTPFTSEEEGTLTPALFPTGLVDGIRCNGRYCDNVSLHCSGEEAEASGLWTAYGSEEDAKGVVCPEDTFVDGLRCSGRFCDSIALLGPFLR